MIILELIWSYLRHQTLARPVRFLECSCNSAPESVGHSRKVLLCSCLLILLALLPQNEWLIVFWFNKHDLIWVPLIVRPGLGTPFRCGTGFSRKSLGLWAGGYIFLFEVVTKVIKCTM
ncbi:hypothetical protein GALMADRAFT_762747 [Galerina marginata CBS 339.88]|uniref:Uncharacterized protein n=1 Tax=Galerina marginata (strain CBS 339.88) TaxID=685588 RepID=A0A067SP90_GALM3|nr:hypothetical protein GALMADRAFT_762747 [Galerina marginata CBS 339.88]